MGAIVQVTLGVGRLVVDGRVHDAAIDSHGADGSLDRARRALDASIARLNVFHGAMFFVFFTVLMFAVSVVFAISAARYKVRNFFEKGSSDPAQSSRGDRSTSRHR